MCVASEDDKVLRFAAGALRFSVSEKSCVLALSAGCDPDAAVTWTGWISLDRVKGQGVHPDPGSSESMNINRAPCLHFENQLALMMTSQTVES